MKVQLNWLIAAPTYAQKYSLLIASIYLELNKVNIV